MPQTCGFPELVGGKEFASEPDGRNAPVVEIFIVVQAHFIHLGPILISKLDTDRSAFCRLPKNRTWINLSKRGHLSVSLTRA